MHRLYLSRSNLQLLLDKLERGSCQAAILKNDISHPTHPTTVPTLVIAVDDPIYYASRGGQPNFDPLPTVADSEPKRKVRLRNES